LKGVGRIIRHRAEPKNRMKRAAGTRGTYVAAGRVGKGHAVVDDGHAAVRGAVPAVARVDGAVLVHHFAAVCPAVEVVVARDAGDIPTTPAGAGRCGEFYTVVSSSI